MLQKISREFHRRQHDFSYTNHWQRWHLDPILFISLMSLMGFGLVILYSATQGDINLLSKQILRLSLGMIALIVFAQVPLYKYRAWTPIIFAIGIALLLAVLGIGKIGKGAQRWLSLGFIRFQPSELMKLAIPMMVAWYLSQKALPPDRRTLITATLILLIPGWLVAKQPDLGTAIMVTSGGASVLFLAGLSWRIILNVIGTLLAGMPILWHFLHTYQRERVLTFLNPEKDPLGTGYHIIQSKIAIGSGGIFGKGWLAGTQSQLNFLPEHKTDFIFAVSGEEFGLLGGSILLGLMLVITWRCLDIANRASDCYSRLVAGGLGIMFFLSAFVNIGMVIGLLPVVGLPLPLVSYGGTAMVTFMAGFGIIMSVASKP